VHAVFTLDATKTEETETEQTEAEDPSSSAAAIVERVHDDAQ
jgi:hypothetical protein